MKKVFIFLLILSLTVLSSCWLLYEKDNGYPGKITFSKKGGTQTFYGEKCPITVYINYNESEFHGKYKIEASDTINYNEFEFQGKIEAPDTFICSCDWLTVELIESLKCLVVTTKPSTKKRKAYIHCDFPPMEYWNIDVIQK